MMKKRTRLVCAAMMVTALSGIARADTLAVWNFDTGGSSAARLAASNAVAGASVSGLIMNTDAGGYGFEDFGPGAVPESVHDGYGFGGAAPDVYVMFLHRADYFDGSAVPDPRPTEEDYTSFGLGDGGTQPQGTTAGLGDGNAPISFTVSALLGQTVTISNLTVVTFD